MNRVGNQIQIRVVHPPPQSVSSSNSNNQRQLNIDVRLNVDMQSGKIRLSVPEQGTSTASALQFNSSTTRLTPHDNNPVINQFMKPSTSSTQPPVIDHSSSGKSGVSSYSQHSQMVQHQNAYGIHPHTKSQQTYCVLCKRGYLPHEFANHIKIHKESSLKEPINVNKLNEKSFLKKQQAQFAIVPHHIVMNGSNYTSSNKEAGSNIDSERHFEPFQPSVKMLHQSNRSHSQHHMHLSSNFSQRGTPNMMIYSNVKSNPKQPSFNVVSSNSLRIIEPSSSHIHMSYSGNHMSINSNSQSERGRNPAHNNVLFAQGELPINAPKLISSQVADGRQSSSDQQLSNVRDVYSVPDPSFVDRLSESRQSMLWQSMVVEGTDYKYDRIKRQLQTEHETVVKSSAIWGSLKQKVPKNLLAMEMAIQHKKEQQNLESSSKQNPPVT